MPPRNPKQTHAERGQFSMVGDEPLSRKVLGVRLPQSDQDRLVELFPDSMERIAWIRQVLAEAIAAEAKKRLEKKSD